MNVPTDDEARHRIHVNTNKHGRVTICEYRSEAPGELSDGPAVRMVLTRDESLRLADAIVDSIEGYDNRQPTTAPLQLAIVVDAERGPTRRRRRRIPNKGNRTMTTTPIAVVVVDQDGVMTTRQLVAGSWSGSSYRGTVEHDGESIVIRADVVST